MRKINLPVEVIDEVVIKDSDGKYIATTRGAGRFAQSVDYAKQISEKLNATIPSDIYNFLEVVAHPDGRVRIYGNGGIIFEAKGKYVTLKTNIDPQASKPSGEVVKG